jgi:Flp pilus assembly protein TadD
MRPLPLLLIVCALLSACATRPVAQLAPAGLFEDQLFSAQAVEEAGDVFAASPEMRRGLVEHFGNVQEDRERALRLLQILGPRGEFRLSYDSSRTRTAAEAFADRAGNCLSLTIMTGALARELGLSVHYYRVLVPDAWSREGDLLLANQHVNLTLGGRVRPSAPAIGELNMTVDFLASPDLGRQFRSEIGEPTLLAMFHNNRAADHLVRGELGPAYWSARAALQSDAGFLPAYNTLGVVYLRAGHLEAAARSLRAARQLEPENPLALGNLELVNRRLGRIEEADRLAAELRVLEPLPPYHFLHEALLARRAGDLTGARRLLERELRREPFDHEVLFNLAVVSWELGEADAARRYLGLAHDNSTTERSRALYRSKLDRMRAG